MKRIKWLFATLALVVAANAAGSSPVMAQAEVLYDAEGNAFSCSWVDQNADNVLDELVCVPQAAVSDGEDVADETATTDDDE